MVPVLVLDLDTAYGMGCWLDLQWLEKVDFSFMSFLWLLSLGRFVCAYLYLVHCATGFDHE